jgi:gamma-glutamyltranspeptidase
VQTNLQLITNVIDLKLNVQEAIEAPHWQHLNAPGESSAEESGKGVLQIENRVSNAVISELIQDTGYEPKTSVAQGVAEFTNWYMNFYQS